MLSRAFYQNPTLDVAKNLLGKKLIRRIGNNFLTALIVETEAYIGAEDSACHASKGKTPRTEVMFGEAGYAYVYFVYGMHYMLNVVTETKGFPAAVLIRAAEPLENRPIMVKNRKGQEKHVCNGPARLCQAFLINKSLNGNDLTADKELWIENGQEIANSEIVSKPRVGIDYADAKDREALWRFYIRNNSNVSKK